MKFVSLILLVLSFNSYGIEKFLSKTATEAILKFNGRIEVSRSSNIEEKIDEQLQHLLGHFSSKSFVKNFGQPAVLSDQYSFTVKSKKRLSGGRTLVKYSFEGKAALHKLSFGRKKSISVPIRLPLALDKIYDLGVVRKVNRCTDDHYNTEGDFFYFWDPDMPGCPLKGNKKDVVRITAKAKKLANSYGTYPEFHRLYNKSELKINLFLGYIEGPGKDDEGKVLFNEVSKKLKSLRFRLVRYKKNYSTTYTRGDAFLAIFEKTRRNNLGKTQKVTVEVLLAETDHDHDDKTFVDSYLAALINSDIMVYDGHSGLGANIGAEYLDGFALGRQYQLFFLNGCSSYPYFNDQYFQAKRGGSYNLEIITSGLSTYTSTAYSNMFAFLNPFLAGRVLSYKTLLGNMEKSNSVDPEAGTYLMGVNGDEDNSFHP